jgi:hypothetical protein
MKDYRHNAMQKSMAENGIGHFSAILFFVTTYPFSASEYSVAFQRIVITQTGEKIQPVFDCNLDAAILYKTLPATTTATQQSRDLCHNYLRP